jgi:predicted ATPase
VAAGLDLSEQPGRSLADVLVDALRRRTLLLVLDNCEHLLQPCAELIEGLLRSCQDLHVLATSRHVLRLSGETVWRVPSLGLPGLSGRPEVAQAAASEAVQLFIAVTYAPSSRTGSWQPWVGMGASKAALEALCRYFAVALAKRTITVNAVSPGLTDDSVLNGLPQEVQRTAHAWHATGWTPMGRMGTPADIGNAVALLCSKEASWITGQTLHVDGGASLMDTVFPLAIQGS